MTSSSTCTHCGQPTHRGDRFCARCGADLSAVPASVVTELVPPSSETVAQPSALIETLRQATLGEYEVLAELGRGGMATVFLAHEIALDRRVAIKVMSPTLLADPGFAERFKREARTAASLSHPNIIPIYAVKAGDQLLYFIMKLIEGRPLDSIIREVGPLPIPMAQAILNQVGGALAYAHKRRVVHRDVKPANIMVDADGWAIVTDFGIAKVSEAHGLTMSGATVGTPSYMSPEQCAAKELTGASDQYSLGVVAYEMLAGRLPFVAESVMALMYAHFNDTPAPIAEARRDVPPGLAQAVMRMLEKDPAKRWPNMEAAVVAIGGTPLAQDDPIRSRLVTLAAGGAAPQLIKRVSTPVSPMPAGHGKTGNIAALTISPAKVTVAVGEAIQLSATARRHSGTTQPGRGITWASANTDVVTVSPTGLATAIGLGIATVTATQENTSATATIAVSGAEPRGRRWVKEAVAAAVLVAGTIGTAWWVKQRNAAPSGAPSRPAAVAESVPIAPQPTPVAVDSAPPRAPVSPPAPASVAEQSTPKRSPAAALRHPAASPPVTVVPQRDTAPAPLVAPPVAQQNTIPPAAAPLPAQPAPQPTPPPPEPVAVDPRPQIEAVIAGYGRALQARDLNAIKRLAPGLGPQALNNLQDFFQRVSGLQANLQVGHIDVNGDSSEADVTGTLEYVNNGTRVTQPLNFRATLERRADSWRIMKLQ